MGRDFRFLIKDQRPLQVIDTIDRVSPDFDLTKPVSMDRPVDNRIDMTYSATSDTLRRG